MTSIKIKKLLRKAHQTTNGGLLLIRQIFNEYAPLGLITVEFGLKLFGIPLLAVWLAMVFRAVLGGGSLRQFTKDWNDDSTRRIFASYRKKLTDALISRNLQRFPPKGSRRIYMGMVKNLHTQKHVRAERVAVDGSKIIANSKKYHKTGLVKIKGKFFIGYKLHILFDLDVKVPLVYILTPINVHDSRMLIPLIKMVQSYYGIQIREVMMDRGYYGAKFFKWLDNHGIIFYIPAKRYKAFKQARREAKKSEFTAIRKGALRYKDTQLVLGRYGAVRCILIANKIFEDWMPEDAKNKIIWGLLTNNWTCKPQTVIGKYQSRWQVEVFFKSCKQYLGLQDLAGYDYRAVNVHIATVLMGYLALAVLALKDKEDREAFAIEVTKWKNEYVKVNLRCEIYGQTVNVYFQEKQAAYFYWETVDLPGGVIV